MLEALRRKEPSFLGKQAQVRCPCHIINLIVKVCAPSISFPPTDPFKAVLSQFYSTTLVPATVIMKNHRNQAQKAVNKTTENYEADSDGEEEMLATFTQEMEDEREDGDEFTDELEKQEDTFDQEMVGEINEELENENYSAELAAML